MPPSSRSAIAPVDIDYLSAMAQRLGVAAGQLIREGRARAITEVDTKTTRADVVTEMDKACELYLRGEIARDRPDDGVYGEEHDERVSRSGVRWIVDPIDGTVNYLYGLPDYAISIAVEVDGVVECGVVHKPATGQTFSAVRGRGSWLDGVRLRGSAPDGLDVTLVSTGFGYDAARRRQQGAVVAELLGTVRDIRRHGSAALDLCNAAAGLTDGYYEWGVHLWDVAAGALIAAEAGLDVRLPAHEEGLVTAFAPTVSGELNALLDSLIRPEWSIPS